MSSIAKKGILYKGRLICLALISFLFCSLSVIAQQSVLSGAGLSVLPCPKQVTMGIGEFLTDNNMGIELDKNATVNDRHAAEDLQKFLQESMDIQSVVGQKTTGKIIRLTRKIKDSRLGTEGYTLKVTDGGVVVSANGEAGLFYGIQTLKQIIQKKGSVVFIKILSIVDWPDTRVRAAHYDTKHHQDTRAYVESFIRDLAQYKMNMLVWEWEDKFEYPSHPEIGAPGAFTMKEMQELTRYARKYHIQIVPLVQGLGHVSFILKWPQFAHLREIHASNFEFCPLKDGTYKLLTDLWKDAIAATPGSEYIHIGTDETYELGKCADCTKKEAEIGKSGLFHLFVGKSATLLESTKRKVMAWEAPMGWAKGRLQSYHPDMKSEKPVQPHKGLVLTESYDYETPDLKYAREAKSLGYPVFAYDPNPGIEQLFLPYFYVKNDAGDSIKGCLGSSYDFLVSTMGKDVFDGVIRTSWDDSGLPMQAWMLSFATTAAYSWNATGYSLPDFTTAFFKSRYGNAAEGIEDLYRLLNDGAYFYMESFERKVWAWGEIGMTHLPDLPRGDALEYDPFWNTEYANRVSAAAKMVEKMNLALAICNKNSGPSIHNAYDIEVFRSMVELIKHTAQTYLDLSALEHTIKQAHLSRFTDLDTAYNHLVKAETIVKQNLAAREIIFNDLVAVWEKTRLPKGMSTPAKKYFFEQDRTRHFANRVPDMTFLIVDEQQLNLESYLANLQQYMQFFHQRFLSGSSK